MLCKADYSYFEGRCLHYGGSMPYLPMLDILKSYFDLREGDGEDIVKEKIQEKILVSGWTLNAFLPALHEILSLKVEDEAYIKMEAMLRRERIFEAIRDLLALEARKKLVIVAFEDLHWIDKTSEMFLDYLAGSIKKEPVFLLLLYRPPYVPELGPKPYRSRIFLDQLSIDARKDLIQSLLHTADIAPEVMEKVLSRAEGNPLFIEEVIHNLLENGAIQRDGRKCVLARGAIDVDLPDTIHEIIAGRMDRAGESIKRMMQVASVMGKDFALRILQGMTGMKEELRSYLVSFEELAFLHERNFYPEIEYIFKHALIQEVAYNSLLSSKRRWIHGRIGRAIEALYGKNLEEYYELLAYHYSSSDEFEKAFHYLKLSGNKAIRKYSLWEAVHYYREALRMLDRLPGTLENQEEKIKVLLLLSVPEAFLGFSEDAVQALQEGERLSREIADERSLLLLRGRLASFYSLQGKSQLAIRYSEGPFNEAEKFRDLELTAPLACELSTAYLYAGDFCKTMRIVPRVLQMLEKAKRERDFFETRYNPYTGLCAHCVLACGMLGDFEKGELFYEKGLPFGIDAHSLYGLGWLELCYGMFLNYRGDGRKAIDHLQQAIEYLTKISMFWLGSFAKAGVGYGYYLLGDLENARSNVEEALRFKKEGMITVFVPSYLLYLGIFNLESGDLKKAQECIEEAINLSSENKERHWEAITRLWLGKTLGKAGKAHQGEAEKIIVQGIEMSSELKLRPFSSQGYLFLGELHADAGKKDLALLYLRRAEEQFRDMGMDHWLARAERVIENL
jgi:tetratricopeptide (TPR) repeat protein